MGFTIFVEQNLILLKYKQTKKKSLLIKKLKTKEEVLCGWRKRQREKVDRPRGKLMLEGNWGAESDEWELHTWIKFKVQNLFDEIIGNVSEQLQLQFVLQI